MDYEKFKKQGLEILDGGGTNGGLYIDSDDADMILSEMWALVKNHIVLDGVSCEPKWYPVPEQHEAPEVEILFITKDNKVVDCDGKEADIKPIKITSCS